MIKLPSPFFNKPYEPNDLDYLKEEIALLKSDPVLTPIDYNRYWEYSKVLSFFRRYGKPGKVLDVGGANSSLAAAVSSLGHHVTITDVLDGGPYVEYLKSKGYPNLAWANASALSLPFAPESFDYVMCISVLEHVPDDLTAISKMKRVLKPDGYLVLSFDFVQKDRPPTSHQLRFYTQDLLERYILWLSKRHLFPIEKHDYSYTGEHIACYGDSANVYNGAMLICLKD